MNKLECLPIIQTIHNTNHLRTVRKCIINHTDMIIDHPGLIKFPKKFRNLDPGIHKVRFEKYPDKVFFFNLYSKIGPNEMINIDNINYAQYITGIGVYPILLYEQIDGNINLIDGTINNYLDLIAVNGKTISIYSDEDKIITINTPRRFETMESITVSTSDYNAGNIDTQVFNLRHELRSLPNGKKDLFVLDAENQRSYILYNVGHVNITGMENITRVESFCNDFYSVYFIPNSNVVKTDDPNALICSHFESIKYDKFRRLEFNQNAICISYDDWRGRGFYIKISNDIAPDIDSFIKFVNGDLFMNHKLEVMFPLSIPYQANVLLDEYHVKTFYNKTKIKIIGSNDPPTCFYKTVCN